MDKLISLCMIVKNEEDVLPRCLDSVREIVDEIIIADTGSTDRTKEIAAKYNALIVDVEWKDDFSAAKNEAVKRATGRWILVLDADEYMEPREAMQLRHFLSEQTPQPDRVYNLPIINFTGSSVAAGNILESNADRVFPNHLGIRFNRPIHEQLTSERGVPVRFQRLPYRIFHTGYLNKTVASKEKNKRNRQIFEKIKQSGEFTPYDYFTLGNEHYVAGEYEKACECYQRAYRGVSRGAWLPHCLLSWINALLNSARIPEAWKLVDQELVRYQEYPEYHTIRAVIYDHYALYAHAESEYVQAIAKAERRAADNREFWLISPDYGSTIPYKKLTAIYYRKRDMSNTIAYMTKTLLHNSSDFIVLRTMMELLSVSEPPDSIIGFLDKLYEQPTKRDLALIAAAALAAGEAELMRHYEQKFGEPLPLSSAHALRRAILLNDRELFERFLKGDAEQAMDDDLLKMRILGALVWKDENYLAEPAGEDSDACGMYRTALALLRGDEPVQWSTEPDTDFCATVLTDMFTLKQFDAYDEWMQRMMHPKLINRMANFFYAKNRISLAIPYYSMLLENEDQLEAESLEHLAFSHFNENMIEEGLHFLRKAMEKNPQRRVYYVTYLCHCPDPAEKRRVKKELFEQFPECRRLPFLQEL